jgi:two-component system, LytTR family, sensor kinase
MTQVEAGTGYPRNPEFSDLWPRLLISPVLGLMVANLSGLIDNSRHSPAGLLASYLYFAFVAFVIWTGNRVLYFRLQRREDWLQRPSHRLAVLLATIVVYSIPVAALLIWIWRKATGDSGTNPYAVPIALLGIITVVVIITHVYETVFLLRDWESDRLRTARIEQDRLEAELEALGREVDPHFLFNNLHALAHLIEARRPGASDFVNALSATYRYVLDSRGRHLVPLAEELDALRRHEMLASIRFGSGIVLKVEVDAEAAARFQLPPVTLAELFQNAIKHNVISVEMPLTIRVTLDRGPGGDATLLFENDLRVCTAGSASTGIGLKNVSRRVNLATGREVTWGVDERRFIVRLPLVRGESS